MPRDLTKVKSKVMFNLTARQLICFGAAAVVGVPLFFVLRDTAGNSGATLGMMAVMLPMFFLAMYQKNGQPAEKILRYYLQARFVRPKVRLYKTRNYYALLMKGDDTHISKRVTARKDRWVSPLYWTGSYRSACVSLSSRSVKRDFIRKATAFAPIGHRNMQSGVSSMS